MPPSLAASAAGRAPRPVILVRPSSMSPVARQIVVAFAAVLMPFAGSGCAATCDTSDQPTERYERGTVVNGIYSSSTAHGDLLSFPGGKRYDIIHHLGFEPILVQLYWSFSNDG